MIDLSKNSIAGAGAGGQSSVPGQSGGQTVSSNVWQTFDVDEVYDSRDVNNHEKPVYIDFMGPGNALGLGDSVLIASDLTIEGENGVTQGYAWQMSRALWLRDSFAYNPGFVRRTRTAYHSEGTSNAMWLSLCSWEASTQAADEGTPDADELTAFDIEQDRVYVRLRYGETLTNWRLKGQIKFLINKES